MRAGLGFMAASGGAALPVSIVYQGISSTPGSTSAGTHNVSIPLGDPSADRAIYIACHDAVTSLSNGITNWSIDGIPLSLVSVNASNGASNMAKSLGGIARVPSGSTGTLSFTRTGSSNKTFLAVYSLYNVISTDPIDTLTYSQLGNAPKDQTFNINVAKDGAFICGMSSFYVYPLSFDGGIVQDHTAAYGNTYMLFGHDTTTVDGSHSFIQRATNVAGAGSKGVVGMSFR